MKPIIEVDHVTKEFRLGQLTSLTQSLRNRFNRTLGRPVDERAPFKALDDVSFTVAPGEVLGIIGHNGAGKSTMLKLLAGISQPTHGNVRVRGRVAPLIEVGAGLVGDMTGRENIFLNAAILGMKRAEIRNKFDEIVAFSELEEFIDTPVKRYSSGMQIKLGFAIATSVESEVLIVDEVLAVGDLAFQRKCFDRMEALIKREGRTVLLVSHNIRQVERLCSRVMLLANGCVVKDGEPRDVCNLFYEASDDLIQKSANRTSARSDTNGDIYLESVVLLNIDGAEVADIEFQQEIQVVVTYNVKRSLPEVIFGIGVHTTDFLYLATNQSLGQIASGPLSPGRYEVSLKIFRFPFLPGVYSMRLGVALDKTFQSIFYSENVIPLTVFSRGFNRAVSSENQEGFVTLEGAWHCARLEQKIPKTELSQ